MKLNELSQAPVFVQDTHTEIETRICAVNTCIKAPDAQAGQFITNPLAGFGVDAGVEERGDAERSGEIHGGGVVGGSPGRLPNRSTDQAPMADLRA